MKNLVYTNRITADYKTLYNKGRDYFKRHGVEIQFDFKETNYGGLGFRKVTFPQGERILLSPYMEQIVDINPVYDFTSFAFNGQEFPAPNIPTGYCYCPKKQPFMDILLDARIPEANYLLIIHEMMHALRFKANLAGFNIEDVMDTYYLNNEPENPLSNFGQQWKLLQPYLQSLKQPLQPLLPQVTITRQVGVNGETLGVLKANGFTAKTLELPWMSNMPNISCIPTGEYDVKWTFSLRLLKFTYEVQNVPKRSGIRIHSANYYYELKGCIALGDSLADLNHDGRLDVLNSRITIKKFEDLMGRKPFKLLIK